MRGGRKSQRGKGREKKTRVRSIHERRVRASESTEFSFSNFKFRTCDGASVSQRSRARRRKTPAEGRARRSIIIG